jgi:predicted lipopolysaccharide heptosyltransferase III
MIVMFKALVEVITLIASFLIQHCLYSKSLPVRFSPRTILVIKLDHLGDVLLATPVFSNLRRAYPSAKIHALVGEWGEVGLRNHPDVDKILRYNSRFYCRLGEPKSQCKILTLLALLRQQKYDFVIDLRGDWFTAFFALMKPTRYRLDYAWLQVANKLGLARFTGFHQLERNLDLLRTADIPTSCKLPAFHTTDDDRKWVDDFLRESEILLDCPLIIIHPGSPISLKRWRTERFAAIADWLIKQKKAQILFVGTRDEAHIISTVQEQMHEKSTNLAGKTTVSQLGELLKRCHLFLGNDSGPMHIAAAVGTQTIGLYGPGNPARFGPVGSNCHAVRSQLHCASYMDTVDKLGGEKRMEDIQTEDVIQTIQAIHAI